MQPVELFSNFFLISDISDVPSSNEGVTIDLQKEKVAHALKDALMARSDLRTVYVVCSDLSKLKAFVNSLIMKIGKVDFSEMHEVRLMNDCIFLP